MNTSNPSSNPFLKAIKTPSNPFSFLAGKDSASPNTTSEQRNVFKQPAPSPQHDSENNQNQANIAANTKNVRSLFQKPNTAPLKPEFGNARHPTATDKVQLIMQVNGQACEVNKTKQKQLNTLGDLSKENIEVAIPKREALEISAKVSITEHIIDCLTSLYQQIRENNSNILNYLKKIAIKHGREFSAIRLRKDQHARLLKGLYYYQKGSSCASKILLVCLKEHPLGKSVLLVAAKLDLDTLLAYYIVRSIYESKGLLPKNTTSFFIHKVNALPEAETLKLSEEFLRQDKIDLLSCYLEIMKGHLPSTFRLLSQREELDILWANLINFQKEDPQIKELVVSIFLRYWQLCDIRLKASGTQLAYLRQKLLGMKLCDTDSTKMIEVGINDTLNQDLGELKENYFIGPFKELYDFFLQNKREAFNCEAAIQNLRRVQLSSAWQRHIQSFLQCFISTNQGMNWEQSLYINKVLSKMKANNILFPQKQRERLLTKIMKQCSIVLGIVYLEDVCSDIQSPSIINMLFGIEEKQLRQCFSKEQSYLSKWIPDISFAKIVDTQLSFLQASIISYIKLGDIASLQREISISGCYSYNVASYNYQFIRRYCELFLKNRLSMIKIQRSINEVFRLLQENKMNISQSMLYYHQKVLMFSKDPLLLASHLFFLYDVIKDTKELASFSKSWVTKVDQDRISHGFADFAQIISMVGQKLLQTDEKELLDTFVSVSNVFKQQIKQTFSSKSMINQNALTLYYVMKKIMNWSEMKKIQNAFIQSLCQMLREMLQKHCENIKTIIIKVERLNPSIKLFILLDISSNNDKTDRNCIRRLFSAFPQSKEQFYTRISLELKGKRDEDVVEAFSLAACYDEELMSFLIEKNLVDLAHSLKEASLNLTTMSILLSLGIELSNLVKVFKAEREMQNMLRGIILRILLAYKEAGMPPFAFLGLLRICINCLNRIEYSVHIEVLDSGHKGGLFSEIKQYADHNYNSYFLYLLCLFISKAVKKDCDSKSMLPVEIEIFTKIGIVLLQINESHSEQVGQFLTKILQYLLYLTKKHVNAQEIRQIASSLSSNIEKSGFKQSQTLAVLGIVQNNLEKEDRDSYGEELQIKKTNLASQIINCLSSYSREADSEKKRYYVKKIVQQMESSQSTKVVLSVIPNNEHLKNEQQPLFLYFACILVEKIDFARSTKEVGKFLIRYISNYSLSTLSASSVEYSKTAKCYLKIINELVKNSIMPALRLLETPSINDQLKAIFMDLRKTINFWAEVPNQNFLKLLHRIELQTNYLPEQWKLSQGRYSSQHRNFTIWRLLQFRQKIEFMREIILFNRLMNGLLLKHYLLAHQNVANFVRFFSQNIQKLQEKSSIEKISAANKLLEGGTLKSKDQSLLMMKSISIKELKGLCGQVVDGLCFLNIEVQSQVIEKLSFSRNSDF